MKVLILAGGSGSRLWPASKEEFPKQFLSLIPQESPLSLLQKTVKRFLSLVSKEDIWVVAPQDYESVIKHQLNEIDPFLGSQIILEPERKNTAPAIAYALKFLEEKNVSKEDVVLITPADHLMAEGKEFLKTMLLAERLAREGKLVLFGIKPHKPEVGYGYIKMKKDTAFDIEAFIEKPPLDKAQEFLEDDSYLWNCGLFVLTMTSFWKELQDCCPTMAHLATDSYETVLKNFSELPNISIDYALMEKSKNVVAIPLNFFWSDIGSWDSIFEVSEKDHNSNVKSGNILDIDTKNSLILGGKKLISTIGLEDMVIIATDDAIFIGKRGETQKVKMIIEELRAQGRDQNL